jgi:cell division protein FtsB
MKKKARFGRWVLVALAAVLLYFIFAGEQGVFELYRSATELKKNRRLLQLRKAQLDSLKTETEKLRGDTAYMEKIAREKLGMAKKDETVYKFTEEK